MPYCELEQREFPDDEFRDTWLHGTVHYRGRPHTLLGDFIDEDAAPEAADELDPDEDPSV